MFNLLLHFLVHSTETPTLSRTLASRTTPSTQPTSMPESESAFHSRKESGSLRTSPPLVNYCWTCQFTWRERESDKLKIEKIDYIVNHRWWGAIRAMRAYRESAIKLRLSPLCEIRSSNKSKSSAHSSSCSSLDLQSKYPLRCIFFCISEK